jgi:demethylmenaquinone methyltransferase / 2-methoxy-6-polyprenyl-1,4-benzoquinol methylase
MTDPAPIEPHPPLPVYYAKAADRVPFVRRIFDDTAPWYEAIDSVLSFHSGNYYRRQALLRSGLTAGMRMLDIATGTGVVARAAVPILQSGRVVGLDPSIGMLLAGREKARLPITQSGGEELPFRTGQFDFLTIGFALRHFADLRATFSEARRVLKPGGRILILEITPPRSRAGRAMLAFYMNRIVPAVAGVVSGRRDAKTLMHYYWDTVRLSVPPDTILRALADAGFHSPKRHVELGIFSEYTATK